MKPFILSYILARFGWNKLKIEKFLSIFFVKFLVQFCPSFEHFEKGDHSQRKIYYMLLDRPTISLHFNVNIVPIMFTGVWQCSFVSDPLQHIPYKTYLSQTPHFLATWALETCDSSISIGEPFKGPTLTGLVCAGVRITACQMRVEFRIGK
jgi:hypothetical protein